MAKPNLLIAAALGLSLMSAASTSASPSQPPLASPLQTAPEFAGCKWVRVAGSHYSISAFDCDGGLGGSHLIADDTLPGFRLSAGHEGQQSVAIRLFSKAPKSPVTSILPTVRAASGGLAASCTLLLSQAESQSTPGAMRYVLEPNAKAMKAWGAAPDSVKATSAPCGPMGTQYVGDRYFEVMPGHPNLVMFVDMGSEIQIFDPATLRLIAKP